MPISHDLMIYRDTMPGYGDNLGRVATYVAEYFCDFSAIDIGANVGDSLALIRSRLQCPVLCIEGDRHFFRILKHNVARLAIPDVALVNSFVAQFTGKLSARSSRSSGTARLRDDESNVVETERLSDILSRYPAYSRARLVKIDTDGMDCSILRAEMDWLEQARPVIFFEYVPSLFANQAYDGRRIFDDLASIGYSYAIFFDHTGEYLESIHLSRDRTILEDLQTYYSNQKRRYADICVVHNDVADLLHHMRQAELEHAERLRTPGKGLRKNFGNVEPSQVARAENQ